MNGASVSGMAGRGNLGGTVEHYGQKQQSTLGQAGQTALPGQLVAGIVLLSSCASVKSSTYASFEHTIVNRLLEEKNDVSKRIPAAILLCLQLYGHV